MADRGCSDEQVRLTHGTAAIEELRAKPSGFMTGLAVERKEWEAVHEDSGPRGVRTSQAIRPHENLGSRRGGQVSRLPAPIELSRLERGPGVP